MSELKCYTKQQSRFAKAFSQGGSCCSVQCEQCRRVYFVTSPGHGDYGPGELDQLREKARRHPDIFIEVPDFSSVDTTVINNTQIVVGCACGAEKAWCDFIEHYASEITEYLRLLWQDRLDSANDRAAEATRALACIEALGIELKENQPPSQGRGQTGV